MAAAFSGQLLALSAEDGLLLVGCVLLTPLAMTKAFGQNVGKSHKLVLSSFLSSFMGL